VPEESNDSQTRDVKRPVDQVTAGYCAELHEMLRAGIEALGIRVDPTQGLGAMLKGLEWFASYPPETHQPDAAWKDRPEDALLFFGNFEQVKRAAIAISLAPLIPGGSRRFQLFKNNIHRQQNPESKALDLFFELDIAHRLLKRGLPVQFKEPDLVVGLSGNDFGVACKRPRKRTTVARNVIRGAKQIKKHGRGLVVINVELLLLPDEYSQLRCLPYDVATWEEFRRLQQVVDAIAKECGAAVREAFAKHETWGVLFCAIATAHVGDAKEGHPGLIFEWFRAPVSPLSKPGTAELLDQMTFGDQDTIMAYSSPAMWKTLAENLQGTPLPE
jgi:hypothetical protein